MECLRGSAMGEKLWIGSGTGYWGGARKGGWSVGYQLFVSGRSSPHQRGFKDTRVVGESGGPLDLCEKPRGAGKSFEGGKFPPNKIGGGHLGRPVLWGRPGRGT